MAGSSALNQRALDADDGVIAGSLVNRREMRPGRRPARLAG